MIKLGSITMAVTNMELVKKFYSKLFHIKFNEKKMFGASLFEGQLNGIQVLLCPAEIARNTATQNRYQFHFAVSNLDRVIETAKENGGQLMGEMIIDANRKSIGIADPDLNSLVFFEDI